MQLLTLPHPLSSSKRTLILVAFGSAGDSLEIRDAVFFLRKYWSRAFMLTPEASKTGRYDDH